MRVTLTLTKLGVGVLLMVAAFDKPLLLAVVLTMIGFSLAHGAVNKLGTHFHFRSWVKERKAALIGDTLVHPASISEKDINLDSSDVVSLGANVLSCGGCGRSNPSMLAHASGKEHCEKCSLPSRT